MKRYRTSGDPVFVLALTLLASCAGEADDGGGFGREPQGPSANGTPSPGERVLEPQDVAIARVGEIRSGPTVSGSLQAATEATIRAEVAGTVVQTMAEEGQRVRKGSVLARIQDPQLEQQLLSAQAAVASARVAVDNARRDVQRYETLVREGASPMRDLDNARSALASAEAQLSSALAQQAAVQENIARATVRSPIDGIISSKSVSAGDVVQLGAELYRVIDPTSMRLEATVPSDQIGALDVGDPVEFSVRGYPGRTFRGRLERISPTADPATRQVRIYVSIPNPGGTLVAGLYAEGRVTTASRRALMVPAAAVQTSGANAYVLRVRAGRAEQVGVSVGLRDDASNTVEITRGLAAGDTVLVGPAVEIAAGTRVRVQRTGPAGVTGPPER